MAITSLKLAPAQKVLSPPLFKTITFIDPPTHLTFDKSKLEGTVKNYCDRSELLLDLNELLVIEYYSRR